MSADSLHNHTGQASALAVVAADAIVKTILSGAACHHRTDSIDCSAS